MNLNATLFAQVVVFFILAMFTMKFIWPPLMDALDERAKKIAEGLAAADRGKASLLAAEKRAHTALVNAQAEGQQRLHDAQQRAQAIIDEAKQSAIAQAEQIIGHAKIDTEQRIMKAREALRHEISILAVKGAEQILRREINATVHIDLLKKLESEL